jgi:hypothetical protein
LIIVAVVVLEIVAYLTYRNSVDGQGGLLNLFILVYALVAVWIVRVADRVIRRLHHDRFANPS